MNLGGLMRATLLNQLKINTEKSAKRKMSIQGSPTKVSGYSPYGQEEDNEDDRDNSLGRVGHT